MTGFVTGFVNRGLLHTSNLPTLVIRNYRLVNGFDLKFIQHEVPTYNGWMKFRFICLMMTKFCSSKFIELDVSGRSLFANLVHNYF